MQIASDVSILLVRELQALQREVALFPDDESIWRVLPGVTNSAITSAVSPHGYFYAPDPSSQVVCTVAGNVAENSGGAHCFKYGVTTTYILVLRPRDYVTKLVSGVLACKLPLDGNPVAVHAASPGPSLLAQASDVSDSAFS